MYEFNIVPCATNYRRRRRTVATARRLLQASDSGAFADWVANSSNSSAAAAIGDLSLGFNAGTTIGSGGNGAIAASADAGGGHSGMWSASSSRQMQINYGLQPAEMGMFVVHPTSFHHHHHHHQNENTINFDPHHHHQLSNTSATNTSLGVGVIPLLTAAPLTNNMVSFDDQDLVGRNRGGNTDGSGFQFFSSNQVQPQSSTNYTKNSNNNILGGGNNIGSGNNIGGSVSSTSSTTTCQDCGNQAKKDCTHRRCRTCCKSRGFDCNTHVKSTWVPAARRRERQLMGGATTNVDVAAGSSSQSTSSAKKPRLVNSQTTTTASHTSTSNNNTPRSFDTSSSHQDASFKASLPGQVRAPAVFKCVRVTSVDEGDDEYAYQAVVRIGGHVFKGFLYDQGLDEGKDNNNNNNNNYPNLSDLHLGGGNGNDNEPSDHLYAASTGGGGLLGGSNYRNPIN
ncbi:hypothetical protein K7X08_025471 [Anisodus acutangulus]|uniref:Uncharacterized protein n=1 Tax=Anisodus acutangulus TaxID=402998 RepID=A0A9Q1LU43_9SOLA|nr:hypothetical protein K7X08_025471 [Anisodus acutangulus]